ncbi:chitin synthase [Pilobolus umbonatus]|nr:chitin synthase [Pilobolus umbonatus]
MQEDSTANLSALFSTNNNNEESITNVLLARYKRGLPYTQLGYSNLVIINPYKPLELLNDASLHAYAETGYKDLSDQKPFLQPHIYELATRAYFHMRRSGEDQNMILSGMTGSGKSTTRSHFLTELLYLSTHNKRESKLSTQIQNSLVILEAFGHARTTQNTSASKFGMFQEVQFNERGRILGTKILTYQFDKSRVTHIAPNERTYHVFYSLLAGTTLEEKTALHINFKPDYFSYLNQTTTISSPGWSDEIRFGDLKSALKICGFKAKTVTQIFQLLAAILHIGNLQFIDKADTIAQEACVVKNTEVLDIVSIMLGVTPSKLETCLTYKLKLINDEVCTIFLSTQTAMDQRDDLARALYNLLFLWIVETINKKICFSGVEEPANVIGILDQFGLQNFPTNGFQEFCANIANERIHQYIIKIKFNNEYGYNAMMVADGLRLPMVKVPDNSACIELLLGKEKKEITLEADTTTTKKGKSASLALGGVLGLLDRDTAKLQSGVSNATDANFLAALQKQSSNSPAWSRAGQSFSFGINHYTGAVSYSVDKFLESNLDDLSPDFVNMFKHGSSNPFLGTIVENAAIVIESHPKDERTVVKAQLSSKPARAPSMRRKPTKRRVNTDTIPSVPEEEVMSNEEKELTKQIKKAEDAYENMQSMTVVDQLFITLRDIIFSISDTKIYTVIHIRPNDTQTPDHAEFHRVFSQVKAYLLPEINTRQHIEYANHYTFEEFVLRYEYFIQSLQLGKTFTDARQQVDEVCKFMQWKTVNLGKEMVWLPFEVWRQLEDYLRIIEKEDRVRAKNDELQSTDGHAALAPQMAGDQYGYNDQNVQYEDDYADGASFAWGGDRKGGAEGSQWGDESEWGINGLADGFGPNMDMSRMVEDVQQTQIENIEEVPITKVRRWWVRFVWLCTWWIPSIFLKWFGKMPRPDVQMAWREKVTLCIIIGIFSGIVLFVIMGLGEVMCPGTKNMYSPSNVNNHNQVNDNYMSIRGVVYDMTKFAKTGHGITGLRADQDSMTVVAGLDVSSSIPPPLTQACYGLVTNPSVRMISNNSIPQANFVHTSGDQVPASTMSTTMSDPYWYWTRFLPTIQEYKKGILVIEAKDILSDADSWGRSTIILDDKVYDLQDYFTTQEIYASAPDYNFFSPAVTDIFKKYRGVDVKEQWANLYSSMSSDEIQLNRNCLDRYFLLGNLDHRDEPQCTFSNYILLAFALMMCSVILVKFLAALQFGSAPTPEDHDKFVICQVPCYTEDEESLRKTIDSLTVMKYDDKRKLLFIIADGMVMGNGNDRPTPRIVLDVLGYDTKNNPEPLMFKSIGEGSKQLNYGKVYSGLYECEGHVVPYMVVAKVGKASERAKPGNRGKRDSQMICMNFLNKVHFDSEMTPLELEMFHQIKNVIGVNPSFYEYILMVDSDTEVLPHSLSYLISSMLLDSRIMGICGETALANENQSWTTMIQVYEYYISHYLAKAFESLFGSVTCLPGCFCMYRIRTPVKNEPLIIAPKVVRDYSENHVDTLHKKNLLSLGEDRYLTTLMMKHFPQYKMKFTPYAMCRTVAPDKWQILLSQRRRWINSTIHNLLEVVLLNDLCGFCCFSMRFVVLIDLIGTLTLPVSFVYLVYLIYVIISKTGPFPILAIGMLAGLYALQILIFVLKRQWQHIGWMFFYIFALPIYSFFLPIYSFWHFDDFSWGNTRVVVGGEKKQIIVTDEEKFDEKMIPLKKWSVYEQELWEMGSYHSKETGVSGYTHSSYGSKGRMPQNYETRSKYSGSQAGDFDYYRDTKIQEKPRGVRQSNMTMGGGPGSVIGSEYGNPMMNDYNRGMMGTPAPGMPMRPMSYASMNPEFMNQNQMMDPSFGLYNNNIPSSNMSAMYDMSPSSHSVASMPRNGGYERGSIIPPSMMGGPRESQYDIPMGNLSQVSIPPMIPAGFPSDNEILNEIRSILATANLMSITKKQVREQLSDTFGVDMIVKKEFINTSIEYILQGRL